MKLVPYLGPDGVVIDGAYIKAVSSCKVNSRKGACLSFYMNLSKVKEGQFQTCPHGMSVFVSSDNCVFTCMRERKTYNKHLASRIASQENTYNPILSEKELINLIEISASLDREENIINGKKASIDSISHEVKQLNAQIKDRSDILLQSYNLNDEGTNLSGEDTQKIQEEVRSIFISSAMIAGRLSLYDCEKNPETLSQGAMFDCVVYKKFDKIRKILKNYMRKNVSISIHGNSYEQIKAYPSFEMIPLLIIENAIKYTHGTSSVNIDFKNQSENKLIVTVDSYSPYCSEQESKLIFTKGFRGKNAQRTSDGSGVGLYFVKMLCDLHEIEVHAHSDDSKISEVSGIAYAPFRITLQFSKTFI